MSDTFDHMGDAFYSIIDREESGIDPDFFHDTLGRTSGESSTMRLPNGTVWKNPQHKKMVECWGCGKLKIDDAHMTCAKCRG